MSKKFAVVLSGCGVYDGSEIHEATMTLLAIVKNGGKYDIFAPNIEQHHVINHITGEVMNEKRNVLIESARIARGKIYDLKDFKAKNYDSIIFPGGFGAAKNLSSFAFDGDKLIVNEEVTRVIKESYKNKLPIGALCIAPVVIAKVIKNTKVTIGNDPGTAEAIKNIGGENKITNNSRDIVMDKKNKIITTPCYMISDANIEDLEKGANNLVKAILEIF